MIFGKFKDQNSKNGFTIVETMIFLAISAIMVAVTINSVVGKQGDTEFKTGLNIMRDNLSLNLTNILNGSYGLPVNYHCNAPVGAGQPQLSTTPSTAGNCTFLGELVSFGSNNYTIYTILGRTHKPFYPNILATNITQANPIISTKLSNSYQIPESMTIHCMGVPTSSTYNCSTAQHIGSLAIISFTGFNGENAAGTAIQAYKGSSTSTGTLLNNGSLQVELIPIPLSQLNDSPSNTISLINRLINCPSNVNMVCLPSGGLGPVSKPINPPNGIALCLDSGTNNESAELLFGGNNSPTSVSTKLFGSPGC